MNRDCCFTRAAGWLVLLLLHVPFQWSWMNGWKPVWTSVKLMMLQPDVSLTYLLTDYYTTHFIVLGDRHGWFFLLHFHNEYLHECHTFFFPKSTINRPDKYKAGHAVWDNLSFPQCFRETVVNCNLSNSTSETSWEPFFKFCSLLKLVAL